MDPTLMNLPLTDIMHASIHYGTSCMFPSITFRDPILLLPDKLHYLSHSSTENPQRRGQLPQPLCSAVRSGSNIAGHVHMQGIRCRLCEYELWNIAFTGYSFFSA